MKPFFLSTVFLSLIFCFNKSEQQVNEFHLSYNILNNQLKTRKYLDNDGFIHFYIANEHFLANKARKILNKNELRCKKLLNLNHLINISTEKRKNLIAKGDKSGVIKLLNNSEIFEIIYLYEKKEEIVYRYKVEWIDEIID